MKPLLITILTLTLLGTGLPTEPLTQADMDRIYEAYTGRKVGGLDYER